MDGIKSVIRPLTALDIAPARRIMRLAFGTFNGVADPENYRADIDFIHSAPGLYVIDDWR